MRITESQLRRIVREEILRESRHDEWHSGTNVAMRNDLTEEVPETMSEAVQTREYRGKTYRATPQAISILKKFNFDVTAAVSSGAFNWVKSRGG